MRRNLQIFLMSWCLAGGFVLPVPAFAGAPSVTATATDPSVEILYHSDQPSSGPVEIIYHPAEPSSGLVEIIYHPDESSALAPPAGKPLPVAELPVALTADRLTYDNVNKVVQADGDVVMQQGDTTLRADEVIWQDATRDAVASGNMRLAEPGAEMAGRSLHANLATGKGLARDSRVFFRERNFHLAGEEIERFGESTYRVTEGRFTTCDGEIPDWQFTSSQVDVTLGHYATARNVWFEVLDWPVFYLPYLIFPVKAERESGLLLPQAGYSSSKGAMLSLAWYQVIDRNLDATLYLDYQSKVGVGKGLEYRYLVAGDNAGQMLFYHVTDLKDNVDQDVTDNADANLKQSDDTFAFQWRHNGTLPGRVRLAADVDYVEDIEFFEDFGNVAEEYARDHTVSTITLQRNWENLNLTILSEYIRDLENNNDYTLQRLPEVSLSMSRRRLGKSFLFLRMENLLTNFTRKEGVDGLRYYFNPELSAPFKPGRWLELTPKMALHGRYYHVNDPGAGLNRDDYDNENLVAEYALTASSRFNRVFPVGRGGIDKLRHSIEPEITYRYIPESFQGKLPYFDAYDRFGDASRDSSRLEYALINRLTARMVDAYGNRSYRELLNLRLSQIYDIAVARDDQLDDNQPFSELRAELQGNPTAESSFRIDASLPVYGDRRFSRVTASAAYASARGNQAALDYTYVNAESGAEPSDYLDLRLATTLLAPVYASFRQRYDFREAQSLESLLELEYRAKCWSLFLSLRNRPAQDGGPDNNEVMAGFALSGLGRVGGFGSKLGPPAY